MFLQDGVNTGLQVTSSLKYVLALLIILSRSGDRNVNLCNYQGTLFIFNFFVLSWTVSGNELKETNQDTHMF